MRVVDQRLCRLIDNQKNWSIKSIVQKSYTYATVRVYANASVKTCLTAAWDQKGFSMLDDCFR